MKKITLGFVAAGMLLVAPFFVQGATIKAGESYYLNPGLAIEDNLYAAGSNVNIAGTVEGDLFAMGGNVFVSGTVEGDLALAGGTVNVNGEVLDDIRLAGGNVTISGSVGGELIAAGGQVSVMPSVLVAKDARIYAGAVNYSGTVNGDLTAKGDEIYLNGTVKGNVSAHAKKVKLGPDAVVEGTFDYYSNSEVVMEEGATVLGATNFHKVQYEGKKAASSGWAIFGFLTAGWIIKLLMLVTAALVAFYAFRSQVKAIVHEATTGFWKEAGRGFILLVVAPVAIIVSFITVIGVPLGFIALLLYAAFLLIASVVFTPLLFGRLAAQYVFKKERYELSWWAIVLAVLVLSILKFIPIVGWLFCFIIFLASFGSFANYVYRKWRG